MNSTEKLACSFQAFLNCLGRPTLDECIALAEMSKAPNCGLELRRISQGDLGRGLDQIAWEQLIELATARITMPNPSVDGLLWSVVLWDMSIQYQCDPDREYFGQYLGRSLAVSMSFEDSCLVAFASFLRSLQSIRSTFPCFQFEEPLFKLSFLLIYLRLLTRAIDSLAGSLPDWFCHLWSSDSIVSALPSPPRALSLEALMSDVESWRSAIEKARVLLPVDERARALFEKLLKSDPKSRSDND